MILSRLDLEAVAAAITKDFFQSYYGDELDNPNRFVLATPINALAKDYLRLRVSYAPLSPDGSICGLTAYSDMSYTIRIDQQLYAIQLKRNQVILDTCFHNCERNIGLFRRRRFTLAHECAHQILFQFASDDEKELLDTKIVESKDKGGNFIRAVEEMKIFGDTGSLIAS